MKRKNFAPILILAIVIVLAGISYFGFKNLYTQPSAPQTIIDTTNWKTYTSVDNSFTLKFPSDWQVQPNQTFGSRSVTEFRFENNPLLEVALIGNYNQITGKPYKNLEEYLSLRQRLSKDILLYGQQAKHIVDAGDPGHVIPYEEVVTFSSDKKSVISLYFNPDFYPGANEDKVFDQIFSTFKFTN